MTESGPAELMRASEYDDEYYNYLGGREQLQDSPYNGARHVSAWVGDEMVGSVVYGQESGSAWVYHIYVRASHEGQGIGRQLCDEVADFARACRPCHRRGLH